MKDLPEYIGASVARTGPIRGLATVRALSSLLSELIEARSSSMVPWVGLFDLFAQREEQIVLTDSSAHLNAVG